MMPQQANPARSRPPTLAEVLAAYQAIEGQPMRQSGDQYRGRGICHHSDDPQSDSLVVTQGSKGFALLKCHAGCEFEAITRALGLHELKGDGSDPNAPFFSADTVQGVRLLPKTHTEAGKVFAYTDEQGGKLYRSRRVAQDDGKTSTRLEAFGVDGWVSKPGCMKSVRRVLYRLPDLIAARDHQQTTGEAVPVFITEGEADADTLAAGGLTATTNPQGAASWGIVQDRHKHLRGMTCYVLEDADEAGAKRSQEIGTDLQGVARDCRIVRLPGLDRGGDVSDWWNFWRTEGKSDEEIAEALLEIAREAPRFVVPERVTDPHEITERIVWHGDEIVEAAEQWLWKGRFVRGALNSIAGPGGSGKTALVLKMLAHLSRGERWPDGSECPQGLTCYLGFELPPEQVKPRFVAAGGDMRHFRMCGGVERSDSRYKRPVRFKRHLDTLLESLDALQQECGAPLVALVLDPISGALGSADAFRDNQVREILLDPLRQVCEEMNASGLLIAHTTKSSEHGSDNWLSGSAGISNACRANFIVGRHPDRPRERVCCPTANFNVAEPPPSLTFEIQTVPASVSGLKFDYAAATWVDAFAGTTADDLVRAYRRRAAGLDDGATSKEQLMTGFLQAMVDEFGRAKVPAKLWRAVCECAEISDSTRKRVQKNLHLEMPRSDRSTYLRAKNEDSEAS